MPSSPRSDYSPFFVRAGSKRDVRTIGVEIDSFNAAAAGIARAAGAAFVDITPISREAHADKVRSL